VTLAETATFRPLGPPAVRRRLYRAIFSAVAVAPEPCDVLFEATPAAPVPLVIVRPAALVAAWVGTPSRPAPGQVAGPSAPRPGSVDAGVERVFAAVPRDRCEGWEARTVDADRTPGLAGAGVPGEVGVQTLWAGGRTGPVRAARRVRLLAPSLDRLAALELPVRVASAREWSEAIGVVSWVRPGPRSAGVDWRTGSGRTLPPEAWFSLPASRAERTPEPGGGRTPGSDPGDRGHGIVLGASGSGKTQFLAERAARAIRRGDAVVALDLHGDLAPSIVARVGPRDRGRILAVDVEARPFPGIAALTGDGERAAAHLVAALKRLTPDGADVYWGFRLERILDSFVRLAQESGGSLLDVYELLTDRDRQESARFSTSSPVLARFLEELGPIARRTPDFLWAAAARLSKIVLAPRLAELLAPADGGLPIEELIGQGRSLLVRLPFAAVGPEAASFAGTLVLARIYLGLAAAASAGPRRSRVVLVADEAQGFSPRLLAEIVAEGRKFGVRALLATQLPERLAPELRSTVAGVARDVVVFRVPRPSAAAVGAWLALSPPDAERLLPDLPTGHAVARDPEGTDLVPIAPAPDPGEPPGTAWSERLDGTRRELGLEPIPDRQVDAEPATERLLLAALAAEEERRVLSVEELVDAADRLPGPSIDRASLADRARSSERAGLLEAGPAGLRLTPAGELRLGLGRSTGATRESAEHRSLLLRAFRTFARRGYRLEIVRQGRYDTTLPDAIFRQIPDRRRSGPPRDLSIALDEARRGWAWRYFGGRDVHVEAEVSGALRPDRLARGVRKAAHRGAFVLFLVGDAGRARRVRAVLRHLGVERDRGAVWTLPTGVGGGSGEARPRA
jgi:hypothetical protein